MPFLKRARPVMKEKVFVTEKRFQELLFQIVNRASGRVSCTETWNYSQIINLRVMVGMMLVIMIIHLTILAPSPCHQESKWGLQQQQNVDWIVRLRSKEFGKFLGFTDFEDFWIKWGRKAIVRFCIWLSYWCATTFELMKATQ